MSKPNFPPLAISVPAFLFFSIASVISAPLAFIKSNYNPLLLLALGLSITAASALCAWACVMLARFISVASIWPTLTFIAQIGVIGLVRGWIFYLLIDAFGFTQPSDLTFRLFNSVLITAIWLTLSSAVVEGQRRYLNNYRTLVNQAVFNSASLDLPEIHQTEELDKLENIVALKANLADIHEVISQTGISQESLEQAASSVRFQIESHLRPMSHRIWFNSEQGRPQIKIWGLMQDSLSRLRFSIPRVLLVCLLPTLVGGIVFIPWQLNLLTVSIFTSVLFLCLLAYKKWASSIAKPLWNLLFLSVSGIATISIANLIFIALNLEQMSTTFSSLEIVVPLVIIIVVWADSTLILVSQDRNAVVDALKHNPKIPSRLANQDRLASYLHNSLQSELTGIAYQLEHSAQNLDSPQSRQSLEQLGALISRSMSQDFANFTETPLRRVQRVVDAWGGIANINVSVEETIVESDPRLVIAVQIIEEGITNAVRHSGATDIQAELNESGEKITVTLTSNGLEKVRSADGVGTKWLSRYALRSHEYRTVGNTRVLEVEL